MTRDAALFLAALAVAAMTWIAIAERYPGATCDRIAAEIAGPDPLPWASYRPAMRDGVREARNKRIGGTQ